MADLIQRDEPILVTGAAGFIGVAVVQALLERGHLNVRCLVRPSSDTSRLDAVIANRSTGARVDVMKGNLLSREDCAAASRNAGAIVHLAAARGEKSIPDAVMNSVVTTRNLLDAAVRRTSLKRFVNVSSFSVYSNRQKSRLLDESSPVDDRPELRGDAYSFAKVKQDQIVAEYGRRHGMPYVIVRPGYVYGPRRTGMTGRVGIGTFGLFLHLGGWNPIPLTYVDNCAQAIVLAALTPGIDSEIFNIVDDDLPSSRRLLGFYKVAAGGFRSVYVPHVVSYALCSAWERYSRWSEGQLPPAFNVRMWRAYWRRTKYTNRKAKVRLGWSPAVSTADGLRRYAASVVESRQHA